jgi:hypothetical protein
MVQKVPSKKALRHVEDIVFEYERWQPVVGWGNKSMLPTDPGRFSFHYPQNPNSVFSAIRMSMALSLLGHSMKLPLLFLVDGQS